jgi:hypothetical protein
MLSSRTASPQQKQRKKSTKFYHTPEGIDYTHPSFLNADGTSRIYSIWDQSIPYEETAGNTGRLPENLKFGTEYTKQEIDDALVSENPWEVVPTRDFDGHGTFLAGVACGNIEEERDFSGVAPLAGISVVKCKQAKESLRQYYGINTDAPCFMESDLMLGIRYLARVAYRTEKPMVICLGVGSSMGSHSRGGALGELMDSYGNQRGFIMVAAAGNEGNTSHHYYCPLLKSSEDIEVELKIGENVKGFTTELWCDAPALCSVALISPSGEFSGRTYTRIGEKKDIRFLLEDTTVTIEYLLVSFESGDECIQLRFHNPVDGIWRIRVFNETDLPLQFHMWLPIQNFLPEGTYFLRSDPDTTLCEPSNNTQIISPSYYDSASRSVVTEASRGYNRKGEIRPDIAAPGVNIYGPLPRLGNPFPLSEEQRNTLARYGFRSGSSAGAAITAGAAILLVEWGILKGNDINMDSASVQKYLIRGANRTGRDFPNKEWGYGTLDLYGVFEKLRPGI